MNIEVPSISRLPLQLLMILFVVVAIGNILIAQEDDKFPESFVMSDPVGVFPKIQYRTWRFDRGRLVGVYRSSEDAVKNIRKTSFEYGNNTVTKGTFSGIGSLSFDVCRRCYECNKGISEKGKKNSTVTHYEAQFSAHAGGTFLLTCTWNSETRMECTKHQAYYLKGRTGVIGKEQKTITARGEFVKAEHGWKIVGRSVHITKWRRLKGKKYYLKDEPLAHWEEGSKTYTNSFDMPVTPIDPLNDAWYEGKYFCAYGKKNDKLGWRMEKLEEFMAAMRQSLDSGKFELARKQSEQLKAHLADLNREVNRMGGKVSLRFSDLPTSDAIWKLDQLRGATEEMKDRFRQTMERKQEVSIQLEQLRKTFSANVVKGMFKSALNWTNMLNTHPLDGIAEYSDLTGKLSLPGTFIGWCETATTDSTTLANQTKCIRQLEVYERFLDRYADQLVSERKAVFNQLRENREDETIAIHKTLKSIVEKSGSGK